MQIPKLDALIILGSYYPSTVSVKPSWQNKVNVKIAEMNAWIAVQKRNAMKYLMFLLPIQEPTNGQWWSWTSTQTSHSRQWKDLGGLRILQVQQYDSFLTDLSRAFQVFASLSLTSLNLSVSKKSSQSLSF